MNLPLSTAFTVSHRFGVVVFSFSFISMHILISFLISFKKLVWCGSFLKSLLNLLKYCFCFVLDFWTQGMWEGFPGGAIGKDSTCQFGSHRRHRFDPWVRKIPWSRKWQLALVFLPRKLHGQRRLVGYSPWSHRESETTEHTQIKACGS